MTDLQIIIGIVSTISGILIVWLGVIRSARVDKATERSAIIAAQTGSVGQVIEGLNQIIDNLQDDNKIGREEVRTWRKNFSELSIKLAECAKERDQYKSERDVLQVELAALKKKYNINGDNNG